MKPQIFFRGNPQIFFAENRRLGSVTLGASPLARPYFNSKPKSERRSSKNTPNLVSHHLAISAPISCNTLVTAVPPSHPNKMRYPVPYRAPSLQ